MATETARTEALWRNRLWRVGFFFVGIVLFYAPFALIARGVGAMFPASMAGNSISDVHTACLRMPLGWLVQPWMWGFMNGNPLYYLPIVILPLAAVAAGPLFCGWLCPAGAFPEHVGRLVPDRWKFDFRGKVSIVPLRYGFFAGLMLAPFVTASICCALCNFAQMQYLVSAATGNPSGFLYFSTTGMLTLGVWFVALGLFTTGGRGWCMFLCPAGATMSLASAATARVPFLPRIRHDDAKCAKCASCEDVCPVRAVGIDEEERVKVNQYLCNECMDCVRACPSEALRYGAIR